MNIFHFFSLLTVLLHQVMPDLVKDSFHFYENILGIDNYFHANKTAAKLQLRIFCSGESPKLNIKTAVWSIQCNYGSLLKVSLARNVVQNGNQSVQFNFALSPESTDNLDVSKQICLLQPITNKHNKWFLYNFPTLTSFHEDNSFKNIPLITTSNSTVFPVLEPIFYHKYGFALILDDLHPWTMQNNSNEICFTLYRDSALKNVDHPKEYYTLKFSVIMAKTTRHAHQRLTAAGYLKRPKSVNKTRLENWLRSSTIPVTVVLQCVDKDAETCKPHDKIDIESVGDILKMLRRTAEQVQILMDPSWAEYDDNLKEDRNLDEGLLIENIHNESQLITVPVSSIFSDSSRLNGFEQFFHVYGKMFKVIDLSQSDAEHWLREQWTNFSNQYLNIDGVICNNSDVLSFKEQSTGKLTAENDIFQKYPNFLTTKHGQVCVESFSSSGKVIVTTTAYKSQHLLQVLTMSTSTKESDWFTMESDVKDGTFALKRMFARILNTALAGYPLVLPTIAFNQYQASDKWTERWLQLTACLALAHFPVNMSHRAYKNMKHYFIPQIIKLRNKTVNRLFTEKAENWQKTGEPLIRPLWYSYPDDEKAFHWESQLLIGDSFMVTLVSDVKEIIYFPKGTKWKWAIWEVDDKVDKVFNGGTEQELDFPYKSYSLPCFTRVDNV